MPALPSRNDVSPLRAALARALGAPPTAVRVRWFCGARGALRDDLPELFISPAALVATLRQVIATPEPEKARSAALLGAELLPGAVRRRRSDLRSTTFLVVDHDALDGLTMGEAAQAFERLGLCAVLHPSPRWPSTSPPHEALKWHGLAFLAPGTSPELVAAHGQLLAQVFNDALGCTVDASTLRPESLAFVQPVDGPRGPEAVVLVEGRALDVGALVAAAHELGLCDARFAAREPAAGATVGRQLFEALARHGAVLQDRGEKVDLRCPLTHHHASGAPNTSCVLLVAEGRMVCRSEHSAAPLGQRGPKGTRALVTAWRESNPALGQELEALLGAPGLEDARASLAAPPFGEAPRRVVALAAVADDLAEAAERAVVGGVPVLYTPTTGAGKSTGKGRAFGAVLRNVSLPRGESTNGAPAGADLVATREQVRGTVQHLRNGLDACGLEGVGLRVHTPAHEAVDANGEPLCIHAKRAEKLYKLGLSARGSLCDNVTGDDGPRARCAKHDECPVRATPWVPWSVVDVEDDDTSPTGSRRVVAPTPDDPGTPLWVAVATHAAAAAFVGDDGAPFLRDGGLFVVDEADPAFAPRAERVTAAGLDAAGALAERLRPLAIQRDDGSRDRCPAPRLVARALVAAAAGVGAAGLCAVAPEERLDLVLGQLLGACGAAELEALAAYLGSASTPTAGTPAARDLAAAAVRKWCRRRGGYSVTKPQRPPPKAAVPALAALAAWCMGERTVAARNPVRRDEPPKASTVYWRSAAAEAAYAARDRQRGVLALDATGDPALMREALQGTTIRHDPVRVEDAADVHRVLVYTRQASLSGVVPIYGVRWGRALEMLEAVIDVLRRDLHRERMCDVPPEGRPHAHDRGRGVLFVPRALALALEVLAGLDPAVVDNDEARGAAAVEALQRTAWWTEADEEHRERLSEALRSAPPGAVDVAQELRALALDGAEPDAVPWVVHYGATLARGSNVLQRVAWVATVCDPRSPAAGELARFTGRDAHEQGDRMAAADLAQCHGRARVVQRHGAKVLLVHVGSVAPLDWHAGPRVEVLTLDDAAEPLVPPPALVPPRRGAVRPQEPEAPPDDETNEQLSRRMLAAGWVVDGEADAAPEPEGDESAPAADEEPPPGCAGEEAPSVVRAMLGAGWSVRAIARAAGVSRGAVQFWLGGKRRPSQATLEALSRAYAQGLPREQLRAVLDGRGFNAVWSGSHGAPGLRAMLASVGCDASPAAVRAWLDGAVLAHPALLEALVRVLPQVLDVYPPVGDRRPVALTANAPANDTR